MDKFHIHVDALKLSQEFEKFLTENLKFWQSNFAGHPEDVLHFEAPIHHLKDAGGSVKCSVKEERIVRWWVISPNLQLPPVLKEN